MRYRYPISYIHVPEKKLHVSTADTLSRAPVADSADAQLQDIRRVREMMFFSNSNNPVRRDGQTRVNSKDQSSPMLQ